MPNKQKEPAVRSETDPKTEDALECSECPWRGYEATAIRRDDPDPEDWWFECPACGEVCAHLPLDELDPPSEVIQNAEKEEGSR
jgi:predicted RNA-binding Zn-ribbon protein involved in translation (DUF1610 family)